MSVKVHFRFNKATGEVEEFLVDDADRTLPEAEHERVALAFGRVVARFPELVEVGPEAPPPPEPEPPIPDDPPRERDRRRG